MKFSIKDFYSKCDQISRKLRIWSHLLKKSLMGNFIFCAVYGIPIHYIDVKSKNLAKKRSKLTTKTTENHLTPRFCSGGFVSNFKYNQISTFNGKFHSKYVSHLVLVFLFPTFKL